MILEEIKAKYEAFNICMKMPWLSPDETFMEKNKVYIGIVPCKTNGYKAVKATQETDSVILYRSLAGSFQFLISYFTMRSYSRAMRTTYSMAGRWFLVPNKEKRWNTRWNDNWINNMTDI